MTTAPSTGEAPPAAPLSRTALRAKRLKPAPGQQPATSVYSSSLIGLLAYAPSGRFPAYTRWTEVAIELASWSTKPTAAFVM